jgi:hypothetical protein
VGFGPKSLNATNLPTTLNSKNIKALPVTSKGTDICTKALKEGNVTQVTAILPKVVISSGFRSKHFSQFYSF